MAAFQGMLVLPTKHIDVGLPRKCDYQTDKHTHTDTKQSDPYVLLFFTGDTTNT